MMRHVLVWCATTEGSDERAMECEGTAIISRAGCTTIGNCSIIRGRCNMAAGAIHQQVLCNVAAAHQKLRSDQSCHGNISLNQVADL